MFSNTIDTKKEIVDNNGNNIIDLTTSIFAEEAFAMDAYNVVKMTEEYLMRPDKASFAAYKTDIYAEMILKYSGISNPFSLSKDDYIMIPSTAKIYSLLAQDVKDDTANNTEAIIKNYYTYLSDYDTDQSSYNELENLEIPSAVLDPTETAKEYTVPYISTDGKTAITIRNGRMYFGEDCGNTATNKLDEKILALVDCAASAIALQCLTNGLSLTDFVRASTLNNE